LKNTGMRFPLVIFLGMVDSRDSQMHNSHHALLRGLIDFASSYALAQTGVRMKKDRIIDSSGNVFADLGFSPEEATLMALRAELIACLRTAITNNDWTQVQAASALGIGQSRVSDLMQGKRDKFSLDMLVTLASRIGCKVGLTLA
jgi:predicted XRE-type DNA-binding protein